mmetsp:Transcript_10273/g.18338  ORF Transcript_10273/g.18338 Transcript_10273/m.18338 type:complete len:218 (+) Transcript_10273:873-1526(+)
MLGQIGILSALHLRPLGHSRQERNDFSVYFRHLGRIWGSATAGTDRRRLFGGILRRFQVSHHLQDSLGILGRHGETFQSIILSFPVQQFFCLDVDFLTTLVQFLLQIFLGLQILQHNRVQMGPLLFLLVIKSLFHIANCPLMNYLLLFLGVGQRFVQGLNLRRGMFGGFSNLIMKMIQHGFDLSVLPLRRNLLQQSRISNGSSLGGPHSLRLLLLLR